MSDGRRFFTLNESGADIWQLLEQPRTLDELRDSIARDYDATLEQIERDTEQLLSDLIELRLVSVCTNS